MIDQSKLCRAIILMYPGLTHVARGDDS